MGLTNTTVAKGGKGRPQEVQGIMVVKQKGDFLFHFNTSLSPEEEENELLRNFRNKFIQELVQLNYDLRQLRR